MVPKYVLSGSVLDPYCLGMLDKTLFISCQDWDLSPSNFFEVLSCLVSTRRLIRNCISSRSFHRLHSTSAGLRTPCVRIEGGWPQNLNAIGYECVPNVRCYISSTSEHFAITRSWIPSFVFPWNAISAPVAVLVRVRGA